VYFLIFLERRKGKDCTFLPSIFSSINIGTPIPFIVKQRIDGGLLKGIYNPMIDAIFRHCRT